MHPEATRRLQLIELQRAKILQAKEREKGNGKNSIKVTPTKGETKNLGGIFKGIKSPVKSFY